jgi:UDP-2,4-diacetamido-2,4,6-trideoxy-beta-L-altropyranose hydrolase
MTSVEKATLLIRADANAAIGTGHVMRCLALAQAWCRCEGRVVFLSKCGGHKIEERIRQAGCELLLLCNTDEGDTEHLDETLDACRNCKATWVVIDGYHFTSDFQYAIRQAGLRLLVLDDCCHLSCYHSTLLLNQNITATDYHYTVDPDTTMLLGPHYALIRKEFFSYRKRPVQAHDLTQRVLVTMGGSDPCDATLRMIRVLATSVCTSKLDITVIVGAANENVDEIRHFASHCGAACQVCVNTVEMPRWMNWADFAITAGGSTCLEFAFIGTPMAALVIADNQRDGVKKLAANNVCMDLGTYENWDDTRILSAIETIIQSVSRRMAMQAAGWALVDGHGAKRVVEQMRSQL